MVTVLTNYIRYYHASRAIPFVTMVTVLTNYIPLLPHQQRHPLRHHGNRTRHHGNRTD